MSNKIQTDQAYGTTIEHLGDLKSWVGKELGLSKWVSVTQEKIDLFAKLTEDEQWIHVDVDRSQKESPFQQTIAHGFFILSLASRFCYDCLTVNDVEMGVNYGLNKVRFISPTLSNSKVRGRISLLEFEEKENGAKYIMNVTFEIEGQEKPACVAEFIAQVFTNK